MCALVTHRVNACSQAEEKRQRDREARQARREQELREQAARAGEAAHSPRAVLIPACCVRR